MPRFFFHLVDSLDVLLDEEGSVMAAEAVPSHALRNARDLIAGDAQHGRVNLGYSIEVRDEGGKTVHTILFRDAVEIVGAQ